MRPEHASTVRLGRYLKDVGYAFTTVTPETHRRVLARSPHLARDLRDVFGWNRHFSIDVLPTTVHDALSASGALRPRPDGFFQSALRFSTLGEHLYAHSAYPTSAEDAVFFGPDTYRYCAFLKRTTGELGRVVDVGCGSGAGGLVLADRAASIVLGDVNENALVLARINTEIAGIDAHVEIVESDILAGVSGSIDTVVCNPPYLVDSQTRTYRDGGADLGTELALRVVDEALQRLGRNGRLLLYTGAPIVDGVDRFWSAVRPRLEMHSVTYDELDVDVFGEELEMPAYREVDRIAAVGLDVRIG